MAGQNGHRPLTPAYGSLFATNSGEWEQPSTIGGKQIKSYSELRHLNTFDERFEYLKLGGGVGLATFGFDRYINQQFYKMREWQTVRNFVITRDLGCDLGILGYEIHAYLHVHHMNPISRDDIVQHDEDILDPEFLITTTQRTHNAIHYGSDNKLYPKVVTQRTPKDTKLW